MADHAFAFILFFQFSRCIKQWTILEQGWISDNSQEHLQQPVIEWISLECALQWVRSESLRIPTRLGFLKAIESIIYVLEYVVIFLTICTQGETVHLNRQSTMNIIEDIRHECWNTG